MPDQDTVLIPLYARNGTVRAYATVDAADADWVNQWTWCLHCGYASRTERVGGRPKTIRLHRELLGLPRNTDGREGDHVDRDRLNCRRQNMRVVPRKGRANSQNLPSQRGATSPYRGVSWHSVTGKWQANVGVDGKLIYLGLFRDELEAAEAARVARARLMPYAVD